MQTGDGGRRLVQVERRRKALLWVPSEVRRREVGPGDPPGAELHPYAHVHVAHSLNGPQVSHSTGQGTEHGKEDQGLPPPRTPRHRVLPLENRRQLY